CLTSDLLRISFNPRVNCSASFCCSKDTTFLNLLLASALALPTRGCHCSNPFKFALCNRAEVSHHRSCLQEPLQEQLWYRLFLKSVQPIRVAVSTATLW